MKKRLLSINALTTRRNICLGLALGVVLLCTSSCQNENGSPGLELQTEDYITARSHFQTSLIRQGPAPQEWTPMQVPAGAQLVGYSSTLPLKALITPPGDATSKKPAILFFHGGFAMDASDWETTQPYRDAGYIVMTPLLRGENGQPGNYSMFYDEVQDALAATEYLASRPDVDTTRMYVAGHSVGGTIALLTALSTKRFRAAASFSGSPDQIAWSQGQEELIPFTKSNIREFQMRSPIAFATSFSCPVRMYYGNEEPLFGPICRATMARAKKKNLDVEAVQVSGDHFTALPEEMRQSIAFFQSK